MRVRSLCALLLLLLGACLTQRDLDVPPDAPKTEPAHLVVRRTRGPKRVIVHEWTVLAQTGRDDIKQGKDTGWYPSGAKHWERSFDHDKPAGTWRKWYENGQLASETTFGGSEQPMRFWHPNGQLSSEGPALDGARTGTWRFYSETGTLLETGPYERSRRVGTWTEYAPDGTATTIEYVDGVKKPLRD